MAITAVYAVIADVMLMAELHGLSLENIGLIPIRRAWNPDKNHIDRNGGYRTRAYYRGSR
jgi:hypothetical protein